MRLPRGAARPPHGALGRPLGPSGSVTASHAPQPPMIHSISCLGLLAVIVLLAVGGAPHAAGVLVTVGLLALGLGRIASALVTRDEYWELDEYGYPITADK
jgi:hypothetical protein